MTYSHLRAESRRFMEELAAAAGAHRQAAEVARVEAEQAAARAVTDSYLTAAGIALGDRALVVEVSAGDGKYIHPEGPHLPSATFGRCLACGATEFEDWIEEHWVEDKFTFVREVTDDGTHGRRSICEWAQEHARGCTAIQV